MIKGGKRELCKKVLMLTMDNPYGVITLLEPDILEFEVKWALESITTNEARGGGWIPAKLFQILKKMVLLNCCTHFVSTLENSAVTPGVEEVSFYSNPKEEQCQRMFKLEYSFTRFTC